MSARLSIFVSCATALLGCGPTEVGTAPNKPPAPGASQPPLSVVERELRHQPASYAAVDPATRFYPEGMYLEPGSDQLWVWSSRHSEQRGFAREGRGWRALDSRRRGPAETRRCIAFARRSLTLCLGRREPGGFRGYGGDGFESGLPARGGFVDFAVDEERARVYVVDAYLDQLWVLDDRGSVLGRRAIGASAYRIGTLGASHLYVLAGAAPRLQVVPTDPIAPVIDLELVAPVRAASYDPATDLLWTAGYRQAPVRRQHGYIENLESFLHAYRGRDLLSGTLAPVRAVDLGAHKLADPVALVPRGDQVFAALSGSGALVRVDASTAVDIARTGQAPSCVLADGDQILTCGFLDGRVLVHEGANLEVAHALELDPAPHELSPYELGEALFYTKAMWADTARNQFTCNSCHWNGLTDYRMHPGTRESRWEQTRPAAGAGMLSPIFSPGQARSLTVATHGFVRALDERYWTGQARRYWLESVRLDLGARERVLSPYEVRLALVTYLARRSVEPAVLRAPGQSFSASATRGAHIFWRDCARCHRPAASATAPPMSLDDGLAYLVDRPLAFTAARRDKTGVLPYFTDQGNRVSPLTQLSRGGPYFSNGSSPTLRHAIERTHPDRGAVHAPANAAAPAYSEVDTQALIDFLLSI